MPEVGREPGWWGGPGLLFVGKMAVGPRKTDVDRVFIKESQV